MKVSGLQVNDMVGVNTRTINRVLTLIKLKRAFGRRVKRMGIELLRSVIVVIKKNANISWTNNMDTAKLPSPTVRLNTSSIKTIFQSKP